MKWRDAVWAAIQREAGRENGVFSRKQLLANELERIQRDTRTEGLTPDQTISRELQDLRKAGALIFVKRGWHQLSVLTADVESFEVAILTQKLAQQAVRIGQGPFRRALEKQWNHCCALTGIAHRELLRASHIVPWSCSNDIERLDPENGLLLSALWDAAFDRGLVSFDDDGRAVRMPKLSSQAWTVLAGSGGGRLEGLTGGNRERLVLHRKYCVTGTWISG